MCSCLCLYPEPHVSISGAGKTTLVEILAGKSKSGVTTGQVKFRTSDLTTPTAPRIGFVPQQDVLPPMLTVYEALLFAARLRLPESIPELEKRERVEELMEKLGITSLRNVRIGHTGDGKARGISGGEMRRVSIGLELIASPDVLILDEPTSGLCRSQNLNIISEYNPHTQLIGLDSVSASRVTKVLHSIAHDPVNPTPVIASIHQPRFVLCQQVSVEIN